MAAAVGCESPANPHPHRPDAGVAVRRLKTDRDGVAARSTPQANVQRLDDIPALKRSPPSATCVQGWLTPERGTPLRKAPLDVIRSRPNDLFMVSELRYFRGPEDPDVVNTPEPVVERWYVKAYVSSRPHQRGRWLVRRTSAGLAVDAHASYTSHGFGPGVWTRSGVPRKWADPFKHPCGQAGPDEPCVGLPREVLGCLAGL
jgi:hypothetical protein